MTSPPLRVLDRTALAVRRWHSGRRSFGTPPVKVGAFSLWASLLLLAGVAGPTRAEETPAQVAPPPAPPGLTNSEELLQAILQVQSLLRTNQLAIEQNERQIESQINAATALHAEALSNGFKRIESDFTAQQEDFSARSARDLQTMQNSNRSMLLVAGGIASMAFLGMLISGFFQWRTSKVWAEISSVLPATREALRAARTAEIKIGTRPADGAAQVADVNVRLLGAIEQLEKRIERLEHSPDSTRRLAGPGAPASASAHELTASMSPSLGGSENLATGITAQISILLSQGQTRLKENEPEAALRLFEQALSLSPNDPEVLIRKGISLERLKRATEAMECYDQAIAANASLTSAYLRKGSLYNRMERFKEALDCYERALQAQEQESS